MEPNVTKVKKMTKKEKILRLLARGKTPAEVAKLTKCDVTYVYNARYEERDRKNGTTPTTTRTRTAVTTVTPSVASDLVTVILNSALTDTKKVTILRELIQ